MADLSYQDVQRAVQDNVRGIHNDVQRLSTAVASIADQAQWIDDMQRSMQQLHDKMHQHDPRSDMTIQQLARDVHELKARFEVIERFCHDMSQYFRAKAEAEKEDNEYRNLSA